MKTTIKTLQFHLLYALIRLFGKKESKLIFDRVLVIAPHPDDEILGLGGTILKMLKEGTNIHIVYLTDGEKSGVWPDKEEIKNQRILLSQKVCESLGIDKPNITRLHIPDGSVPNSKKKEFNKVVESIREIIIKVRPDAVFATHPDEYWPFDHVACAELAYSAVIQSKCKCQLWYYWVWTWYNIRIWELPVSKMNKLYLSDIKNQLSYKKDLIRCYLEEFTPDGKPWSGILPQSLLKALSNDYEILEISH